MPWQADSYSPIDFSLTDPHWGTLNDWRDLIDEMHSRGMYIMLDFTVGTMNDFIAFEGCVDRLAFDGPLAWQAARLTRLVALSVISTRRRRSASTSTTSCGSTRRTLRGASTSTRTSKCDRLVPLVRRARQVTPLTTFDRCFPRQFSNTFNDTCQLPVFWGEDGYQLQVDQPGCYASEFDQYGDMEAFGVQSVI